MAADTSPDDQLDIQDGFTGGKLFDTVFARGMALVEETASYLDGPGREAATTLPREAGLTYSAWSMELTTRLMQAASWLVMQKAVRDGEMRRDEAAAAADADEMLVEDSRLLVEDAPLCGLMCGPPGGLSEVE